VRLLDLFCGAGGAAMGYRRAGFEVSGVDWLPQPRFPFSFWKAGALAWLEFYLAEHAWPSGEHYDAIHASPPCQFYSVARNNGTHEDALDLIPTTLGLLRQIDVPWVVENVPGAPLPSSIELCGASFGLGVAEMDLPRHRRFETSFPIMAPPCSHRRGATLGVYGHGTNAWHREKIGRNITQREKEQAMGIDWMRRDELSEAVPPAYTEFIGEQIREHLLVTAENSDGAKT
jgi:DNA (cytosine-5)-methyltransferase 1